MSSYSTRLDACVKNIAGNNDRLLLDKAATRPSSNMVASHCQQLDLQRQHTYASYGDRLTLVPLVGVMRQ